MPNAMPFSKKLTCKGTLGHVFICLKPSSPPSFCLGWCSNFVGSESGHEQSANTSKDDIWFWCIYSKLVPWVQDNNPLPFLFLPCITFVNYSCTYCLYCIWRRTKWFWCGKIHYKGHWKGSGPWKSRMRLLPFQGPITGHLYHKIKKNTKIETGPPWIL